MELYELGDLISRLGVDPTEEQLAELYDEFDRDFMQAPYVFKGCHVKIATDLSNVAGFENYPETFVHLVTRKGQLNKRVFDRHRANKIHWIKCILDHYDDEDITYFKFPKDEDDPNSVLREYYWYKDGDFLVIMEEVIPDYIIITSFHIDDASRRKYFETREAWYRNKGQ